MKTLLHIWISVGLLYYMTTAGFSAFAPGSCECGVFLRKGDTDKPLPDSRIVIGSTIHVPSCDEDHYPECSRKCKEKMENISDGGKLSYRNKNGRTMADLSCLALKKDVRYGQVAAFARLCNRDWTYVFSSTPKYLCCINERPVECSSLE